MISRRVLLGTGAAVAGGAALVGVAHVTHVLDDAADLVGLDPKPEPDPEDDRLVRRAASGAATLLAMVEATAATHRSLALAPFEALVREQLTAVGGTTAATDVAAPPAGAGAALAQLEKAFRAAAKARAADALRSFSPDLTRVLASMSAGLAQGARGLGDLR
ncbi:hypothetical protein GEV29_10320 [Aeromicrobium sp. SMF47]|uniref:hypothetical protein n=1 Tax=Aeromicrobium TaxID=2040 RepID=UPI00129DA025|nr:MULTISPECIES: hypothetical protein [Aeromicrobium]MRJ76933.1 hypothetical protein [Aeromicrobium yanjiei]MRK01277.1 hypothetical protein [Aeromicrobium sp. S22]